MEKNNKILLAIIALIALISAFMIFKNNSTMSQQDNVNRAVQCSCDAEKTET